MLLGSFRFVYVWLSPRSSHASQATPALSEVVLAGGAGLGRQIGRAGARSEPGEQLHSVGSAGTMPAERRRGGAGPGHDGQGELGRGVPALSPLEGDRRGTLRG